jgi:hypothetical protein
MTNPRGRYHFVTYRLARARAAFRLSTSDHACLHTGRCLGGLGYSLGLEGSQAQPAVIARCS